MGESKQPNSVCVHSGYVTEYKLGDLVYLVTDDEQKERIVTGIQIRPNGRTFALSYGTQESWHYAIEISSEKSILRSLT